MIDREVEGMRGPVRCPGRSGNACDRQSERDGEGLELYPSPRLRSSWVARHTYFGGGASGITSNMNVSAKQQARREMSRDDLKYLEEEREQGRGLAAAVGLLI